MLTGTCSNIDTSAFALGRWLINVFDGSQQYFKMK